MATHSGILAWEIPWPEEPGRLQSEVLQSRTRLKRLSTHTFDRTVPWYKTVNRSLILLPCLQLLSAVLEEILKVVISERQCLERILQSGREPEWNRIYAPDPPGGTFFSDPMVTCRAGPGWLHRILSFFLTYFILECSQLTMRSLFPVDSKGTQPYIRKYPFSPKPPSGRHMTLSKVPCAAQ